ncbi:UNVERIFIED_CONTAM: hypothetical protein Cloal_2675 [Acetivibrio alkalicellulosi]
MVDTSSGTINGDEGLNGDVDIPSTSEGFVFDKSSGRITGYEGLVEEWFAC